MLAFADFSFSPLSLFSSGGGWPEPFSQIEVCSGSADGSALAAAAAAVGSAAASSAVGCGLAREASRSTVQVSPPEKFKKIKIKFILIDIF